MDEYAHLCEVQRLQKPICVDLAAIGGKTMPLPGEALSTTSWLRQGVIAPATGRGHSSQLDMSRHRKDKGGVLTG